ncbi:MAG: CHAT domain-containing protein [Armatimonadetes bacterium]|nr:CHAT domain-containing protein [Armatimonadota bacterium]
MLSADGSDWEDLNRQAVTLFRQGKYSEAVTAAEKALKTAESTFGPDHPNTATSLNNLAELYRILGKYAEAEPLYKRALEISERSPGAGNTDLATSLNNLALLYYNRGRYAEAEPLYERALAILKQALGSEHLQVASALNNLAALYDSQGRYAVAEPLYRHALAIREEKLGPNDPDVALILNNLASLFEKAGRYSDAEGLCRRALAIRKETLGSGHPDTAESLSNLAMLCDSQGKYAEAEPLYKQALHIREKLLGPEHPDVAVTVNNLAMLYESTARYAEAEPLYKRALAIREKKLGPEHPDVAVSLNNLAEFHRARGKYGDAEPLCRQALSIREKTLGLGHPDTAASLNNLAILLVAMGRGKAAFPLMVRASKIYDSVIEDVFSMASEKDKLAFLDRIQGAFYGLMSFVLQESRENSETVLAGLNALLRRKGLVLDALSRERQSLIASDSLEVRGAYARLQQVCTTLATLTLAGPGSAGVETYQRRLDAMRAEKEALEKELTRLSGVYRQDQLAQRATASDVCGKIPQDAVLIEYATIPVFRFDARTGEAKWSENRYLAYVLFPSSLLPPPFSLIDLGDASVIEQGVREFRKEMRRGAKALQMGTLNEQAAELRLAEKGKSLYNLILAPLKQAISGRKVVFVAPDAELNLVPFGVLQDGKGRYLTENYRIVYLSTGRDLLRLDDRGRNSGETVIVADPDFDSTHAQRAARLGTLPGQEKPATLPGAERSKDLNLSGWGRLSGTRAEGEALKEILSRRGKLTLYMDKEALEETVKQLRSPEYLHFATHGFFLEETRPANKVEPPAKKGSAASQGIENPMLRSGLVLAGANRIGREKAPDGADDGILTALEVSGMQLQGTDLVVLSACETGMGDLRRGEGVFGLRRAFQLAGARSVVMSLWSVPDEQTRELMVSFCTGIKNGDGKAPALRNASLTMIEARRRKYGAAHPLFWGAFVLVGEP